MTVNSSSSVNTSSNAGSIQDTQDTNDQSLQDAILLQLIDQLVENIVNNDNSTQDGTQVTSADPSQNDPSNIQQDPTLQLESTEVSQ